MLEWPNGCLGSLHISTAEAGRPERLEIVGTKGVVQLGGEVSFKQFPQALEEFIDEDANPFAEPDIETVALELGEKGGSHVDVYRNLSDAIHNGVPLVSDGTEGRMSLELANAMLLSSHLDKSVTLPLNRAAYRTFLEDRKAAAKKEGVA